MRTPPAHGGQFLNVHLGRARDFSLFWSFPTVELLLLKVDAVADVLGAKGKKIFDTESIRATLTEQTSDSAPGFCVLAIASATGPWHNKPGLWHAGRVTTDKGTGVALTLIVDAKSVESIPAALDRQWSSF